MAFSERIQQLCPGVNNEQATELREFLVKASERLEAEPSLMAISLKTLEQEATDQGYAWDSVVMVLQEVATASSADEEPQQLVKAWQTCMASEGSVADFTTVLTDRFPEIKSTLVELVDEAKEDHRALSGVAGGSNVGRALASPWKKTPNATQKQRRDKRIIGVAEVFVGLSAVNYTYFSAKETWASYKVLKVTGQADRAIRVDTALVKGEVKYSCNVLGIPKVEYKFDNWFGRGGYFNYKFNKIMPGGIFRQTWQTRKYDTSRYVSDIASDNRNSMELLGIDDDSSVSGDTNDIINDMQSHRFNNFKTDEDRFIDELNEIRRGEPLQRRSFDHLFQRVRGMDLDPRRMSERIHRASGDLLNDGNDGLASLGGESDLSLPSLSGSGKTLPARMSEGLWDDARNSVMSDLSLDMEAAERGVAESASADISGVENKELGLLDL